MDGVNSEERLELLFERHYSEVLAYCVRRIGSDEADDIAAEVFTTAWRRIDEVKWETARSWLFGIARKILANRFRSLRRRKRRIDRLSSLLPIGEDTPEVYVVQRDEDKKVIGALKSLKRSDQEILMLAAWEGLTGPEIAETLNISPSAAEQRLHRAKKRYAKTLKTPEENKETFSPRAANEIGGR